ncbi:uncharacterized protein LOC142907101 [Petromyzon marinus]|uniref:uncharacterized protein LOC142907101 n=1 Tax=Petromyzon marinus TaxID=7757 RepID=UPI003F70B673
MFPKQAEADQPNASRVGKGRYATTMGSYYHVPCAQPSDSHSPVLRVPPEHVTQVGATWLRCVNIATGETKAAGRGVSHPTHTRGSAGGAAIANCQPSQTTAVGPGPPGGGESICTIVAGAWSHRLTGYSQNACGKGSAAGVCTQLWRGECGGNSTPAAPLAYLKLRAGPGAPRGSWHGYNATRTRREETDSYVDVSDSKQYSSSVKMWTTDLSQTPILHRGPHALHTSHVSSEPQQRRLDVPACRLNDTYQRNNTGLELQCTVVQRRVYKLRNGRDGSADILSCLKHVLLVNINKRLFGSFGKAT